MIEKFKIGYYYKYTGSKIIIWNDEGMMDKMLDGKWHKCIESDGDFSANFEDIENNGLGGWYWGNNGCLKDFHESKINPDIKRKLRRILENDRKI